MMRAVLTFHSLDESGAVLSFAPKAFARLVTNLLANGIPIVSYPELLTRQRGVTITFDDGMRSVHGHALPVLREHGVPAHLFLTTGAVGGDNRWPSQPAAAAAFPMLDWDEVFACATGGVLIENHTQQHPDLRLLGTQAIADECAGADALIQARVGRRPRLFAYPYGQFDARVAAALAGRYEACFSTRMAYLDANPDPAGVPRIDAYYLRKAWIQDRLMTPLGGTYLAGRSLIRRLRGIR
jgi:peptidoglycan/xylan/chitin deacetylase (PgdA/CDA1 family)